MTRAQTLFFLALALALAFALSLQPALPLALAHLLARVILAMLVVGALPPALTRVDVFPSVSRRRFGADFVFAIQMLRTGGRRRRG